MELVRRRTRITEATAAEVKRLLYAGYTQHWIAHQCGVSQSTVWQISSGARFDWVPWPKGSKGPMPEARIEELNRIDTEERKKAGRRRKVNSADEHIHAFRATASDKEREAAEEAAKAVATVSAPKTASIVEKMRERGRRARGDGQ